MTPDALGGEISNPQSLNRYSYALNNPTTLTDPLGLETQPCMIDGQEGFCTTTTAAGSSDDYLLWPVWQYNFCAAFPFACGATQPAFGFGGGGGGGGAPAPKPTPPGTGFTLGLRLPNQTFNQCMSRNAANYSAGGFADLALGFNNVFSNRYLQVATGNTFTSLYAGVLGGSGSSAVGAAAPSTPDLLNAAMGSPLTYGRRTTDIMSLNLEGVRGGPPLALSPAPEIGEIQSVFSSASRFFNLGFDAATKGAIDFGLFGAEVVGCSISQ